MKKYRITNRECGTNDGTAFMFTWLEEVVDNGEEKLLAEEEWLNEEKHEGSRVHLPENWAWENILEGRNGEDGICDRLFPEASQCGEQESELAKLLADLWKRGKGATVTIER